MSQQSPKQIIHRAAELLRKTPKHTPLSPEESEAIDNLLNNDNCPINSIAALYIRTLIFIEKSHGTQNVSSAEKTIQDMNDILTIVIDEFSRDNKYRDYQEQLLNLSHAFLTTIFGYIETINIQDISDDGLQRIQDLLKILTNSKIYPVVIDYHKKLLDEVKSINKPFDKEIDESLIRIMVLLERVFESNTQKSDDPGMAQILSETEDYFIEYAIKSLEEHDINGIWDDNVLNVVLQLRAAGSLGKYDEDRTLMDTLDAKIKQYLADHFSPEEVEAAKKTMEEISTTYRDEKLYDPKLQDDYLSAYKIAYLYELLSGKQRGSDAITTDYASFILSQIEILKIKFNKKDRGTSVTLSDSNAQINDEKNQKEIDMNILLLRVLQEICTKEIHQQVADWPDSRIADQSIIVNNHIVRDYNTFFGGSHASYGVIEFCTEKLIEGSEHTKYNAIDTTYHELDHYVKESGEEVIGFTDFISYKACKVSNLITLDPLLHVANYNNLYNEKSANLSGMSAVIRNYNKFPAGEPMGLRLQIISKITDLEHNILKQTLNPKLTYFNVSTGKWEETSEMQLMDQMVLDKHSQIATELPVFWETLKFEYREDGTPKELQEIINDQEEELQSHTHKSKVGPKSDVERAMIRFQIMMERSIEMGKEEECIKLINEFVMKHKELFKEQDFFKKDFDPRAYSMTCIFKASEYLESGTPEGLRNAQFLYAMDKVLRPVMEKHKKTEAFFDFLFRKWMRKDKSKVIPTEDPDMANTRLTPKPDDEPEGQDPQ